jgi:uncharacterized protein (TIGR02001 family)
MLLRKQALLLVLIPALSPLVARAQESAPAPAEEAPASNWSWSVIFTTDYAYRGTSLSDGPALQAGLDYAFGDSGFYVSTFASNADFGMTDVDGDGKDDGPNLEFDAYIGWNHDLSEDWNLDLSLARYTYFGARDIYGSSNYSELIGKLTYREMLSFGVSYADDYGNLGFSGTYYTLGGEWPLGNEFMLDAAISHSDFSDGVPGYEDWQLGVSRQFGPVNATGRAATPLS